MAQVETSPSQLDPRLLLKTLRAFRKGDFSVRLPSDLTGIDGEIAEAFNDIADLNKGLAQELDRVARVVGKEGRIGERGRLAAATGCWSECIDSVNSMIGDLVQPTTEVARVIGAVAKGDLSQSMQLEIEGRPLRGEFLRIGKVVNTMVGQLSSFASEVTRVAKEVGTEGKLGGQAQVKGVAGTWKDLTDNVNMMAANLTGQVRNIAEVTTAVANGNLSKKITVDVKGEMLELKNTINTMVDQLNSFASEVTRVAKEVGTEGKLGGQAQVKGVGGTWKDLTDNVNMMAANLTGQVRGIAEVVTAVAVGNLTRKLTVDAKDASCSTIAFTTLPMRRNSPRSGRPSISTVMVWERSPLATAPITRATSAVGCTMSSISSLTARMLVSQPPVAFLTRPRWVILPSLPTTRLSRSSSSVMPSLRPTISLNRREISPSWPGRSSPSRTVKSPRRKLRSAVKSWRRSRNSRGD